MALSVLPPSGSKARRLAFVIMALAPLLYGALALALGQDANWDLRNYHWYNAYAFLNNRYAMDLLPSQTPFFYNPTLDVPFFLLATHVPMKWAGFILASVQGLNFLLLFMIAQASLVINNQRNKVIVCAFLAAFGMLGAGSIAQLGTVFYDNITSLGMFAAALIIIANYEELLNGSARKALLLAFLAGVPAGLMVGLKLPCVVFCVGLCGALLLAGGNFKRRFLLSFIFGVGVLAGIAGTLGHWAWFLQQNFGNPLFPYFNDIFKSPLAPLTSARDMQYLPWGWHDQLFYPFIFSDNPLRTGEIPWRDFKIVCLYTLLPITIVISLLFGVNAEREDATARAYPVRFLLLMAAISYFVWMRMFAIYRYVVPLEMLAPLLIVFAVGMLPLKAQIRGLIALFIMVALVFTLKPGTWGRVQGWLDGVVDVKTPEISEPENLMIIMAGYEPYSHLVTAFPPQVSFVRIQSNFTSPDEKKGINQLIRERIEAHRAKGGKFKLLIPKWQHIPASNALKYYSFTKLPKTCQTIDDHLYDRLDLCDLAYNPKPVR